MESANTAKIQYDGDTKDPGVASKMSEGGLTRVVMQMLRISDDGFLTVLNFLENYPLTDGIR